MISFGGESKHIPARRLPVSLRCLGLRCPRGVSCGGTEHRSPLDGGELVRRASPESRDTQRWLQDQTPSRNRGTDFAIFSSIFRKGCRIKAYLGSTSGDAVLLISSPGVQNSTGPNVTFVLHANLLRALMG